jgi:hypothetical protein
MGVKKKRKLEFPLLCRIIPKIRFIAKVEMKKIFERGVVEANFITLK